MTELAVSDYLKIFHSRHEHSQKLLELSRRQMSLINSDDYTQLLVLLGQKQRVLGHLDEIGNRFPDLWKTWRSGRNTFDDGLREDCEHILAETEAILAELIQEETTSTEHLTERRDSTKKQLQDIAKGSEVHDAYRDSLAPVTHRHLNIDQ